MKTTIALTISIMLLQALGAPQNKPVKKTAANNNPSDLSLEELNFIDQMRRGGFAKPPKTLSPCAKAILGCCEAKVIDSDCSEALQCGGHFFDDNPCDDKFIIDALNAARHYYDQYNKGIMPRRGRGRGGHIGCRKVVVHKKCKRFTHGDQIGHPKND